MNAVRSPMAEGIMKKFHGHCCYVQSAGVQRELEIDGFAIAVCREIDVQLDRHRVRTIDEMSDWGDDIESFELIVALSPAAQREVLELTRFFALSVEYWQILDPTGMADARERQLEFYRQTRDQIYTKINERFGI